MGLFKKITDKKILFTQINEHKYKLLINIIKESDDSLIINYIDDNIKKKITLKEEKILSNYRFIEKTKNLYYKKYIPVDPKGLIINEMELADAGIGGTAENQFSSDFYAPNDARNILSGNKTPPIIRRNKITDTITKSKKKIKKKKSDEKKDNL